MSISKTPSLGKVDLFLGKQYLYFRAWNIISHCRYRKILTGGIKADTINISLLAELLYSYRITDKKNGDEGSDDEGAKIFTQRIANPSRCSLDISELYINNNKKSIEKNRYLLSSGKPNFISILSFPFWNKKSESKNSRRKFRHSLFYPLFQSLAGKPAKLYGRWFNLRLMAGKLCEQYKPG